MSRRSLCVVAAALCCLLAVPLAVQAQSITVEQYMKMDGDSRAMFMVGLIEGTRAAAIVSRIMIAQQRGRPEKEVVTELSACRWDSYASITAYVEAELYRVPREKWASTPVARQSFIPLAERFNAGCPWGK